MKMVLRGMRLDTEEAKEAIRKGDIRPGGGRRYSLMLLDEAVRVAREVGPTEAARQTGVGIESIKKHARRANIAAGIAPTKTGRGRKYSDEQKRLVIIAALKYKENTQANWTDCFRRACVNHGLPAKAAGSIHIQYQQGTFTI